MPDYALLLAHDEHPGPTTDWPAQPGGPCEAWAEWFESTPLLFSLLLGDARHLPELVPCSAYQDKESLISLAAPMDQVKARWQWLKAQMEPLPAHWPDSVRKSWQQIDAIISQSQRHWLLLDCATLIPHDFDTPEYAAALGSLRERCLQWDCSADSLPEALQSRISAQPLSSQASVILRLRFTGSQAQEPDLGALFSALGGQVRLLHGGVEHIQGHALGQLLLSVTSTALGAEELRKRAGQWAQQVEVVGYGI